jgi:hypothetical protein
MREASSFKRADGLHYINTRRSRGREGRDDPARAHDHRSRLQPCREVGAPCEGAEVSEREGWGAAHAVPHRGGGKRLFAQPMSWRLRMFWLIAFETGVRSAAIEDLTWERVDLVNRVIDFRISGRDHKNKRRPIAPINDRLYPRLVAAKERWSGRTSMIHT